MRRGLHRHVQRVVGIAQGLAAAGGVEAPGHRVGAGGQHGVDRVPAPAEQAVLRAGAVERDAHGEHRAAADQPGGGGHVGRLDVVEGADLVGGAPAAPVAQRLGGGIDGGPACGDVHARVPVPAPLEAAVLGAW